MEPFYRLDLSKREFEFLVRLVAHHIGMGGKHDGAGWSIYSRIAEQRLDDMKRAENMGPLEPSSHPAYRNRPMVADI